MAQTQSSVESVQKQLDNAVARIHEDIDLTAEAKNRMIREVYSEARSKVIQEAEEARQEAEIEVRIARRAAFAPPVLEGRRLDDAMVAKWFFEEIESLKEVREAGRLEEILQEAVLFNNLPRAKAVLCAAYRLNMASLVAKYFENFPDERPHWDAFVAAAENYNELESAMNFFSAPSRLKPLESYLA